MELNLPSNEAVDTRQMSAGRESALNVAIGSGRFLLAIWHLLDGHVHLYREINDFPFCDLTIAQDLLSNDLADWSKDSAAPHVAVRE